MRTLVFSDTHLSTKFDRRLFDALTDLISKSEGVIINGDFWEGLAIKFDDFLRSEWRHLFPLLKQKKAIYIYGNHDHQIYSDERVYRFCSKAVTEYCLETPSCKYVFKHGHEFLFPKHSDKCLRKPAGETRTCWRKFRLKIAEIAQSVGFGLFGPKVLPAFINHMSSEIRAVAAEKDSVLVCGHTHRPYHNKELNFVDIGFFSYGWANYMEIDESGEFNLISRRY